MHAMNANSSSKIMTIEDLLTMEDTKDQWLVQNMLPRIGRAIVYGSGGTYKTTTMFDLAVGIASGGALLRQFPIAIHGPVLIISTESSRYTNRDRILSHIRARESQSPELAMRGGKMVMPNTDEMPIFFGHQAYDFDDKDDQTEFIWELENVRDKAGRYPVFILLDPLDSFISGDENSARETKPFRRFCDNVVKTYETCLAVIHHSTKNQENPSIRGSGAWRGWADTSLFFKKGVQVYDNQTFSFVDVLADKQRDGEEGRIFSIIPNFDPTRKMTTFTCIQDGIASDAFVSSKVQQAVLTCIRELAPITQNDIMSYTKMNHARVKPAMQHLLEDGYIINDMPVDRSTSKDGNRYRTVKAWRATEKISQLDSAAALLRAQVKDEQFDLEGQYIEQENIELVGPAPIELLNANTGNSN